MTKLKQLAELKKLAALSEEDKKRLSSAKTKGAITGGVLSGGLMSAAAHGEGVKGIKNKAIIAGASALAGGLFGSRIGKTHTKVKMIKEEGNKALDKQEKSGKPLTFKEKVKYFKRVRDIRDS